MRTKKIFLFILLAAFGLISCEEGSNWTTDKTVDALKQALEIGAEKAVDIVSKPDGYLNSDIHIALPDDAQKAFDVISFLNKSGFGSVLSKVGIDADLESTLTTLINRAAEDAAPQAVNVFTSAITGMTI